VTGYVLEGEDKCILDGKEYSSYNCFFAIWWSKKNLRWMVYYIFQINAKYKNCGLFCSLCLG
jgi:hypothetical protein